MRHSQEAYSLIETQGILPQLKDFNVGIILICIYYIFEFGSLQVLFPTIAELRLPLMIGICSVLYAIISIVNNKIDFNSRTTRYFILICIFIAIYSLVSTKDPDIRWNMTKGFIGYLSYYIIVVTSIKRTSQIILLFDILLLSVLFSSYHGIMQGGLIWMSMWFKDENTISLFAAMTIPFAIILFHIHRSSVKRMFYTLCIVTFVTVNIVAMSRGGTLALILSGSLCWLLMPHKIRNLLITIAAILIVFASAPNKFFEEMNSLKEGTQEGTAADRIYLWGICLDMFNDNPIIGVGPSNYPYYFSNYDEGRKYPLGTRRPPHTTPLQWLAETGIVGCTLIIMLQLALYRNWRALELAKHNKRNRENNTNKNTLIYLNHACAISQVSFWFGAIFLSLIPYPFYWFLPYLSETIKNSMMYESNNVNVED